MRPDGQGTDELDTREQRERPRSVNSLERDIIKVAVAFAIVALVGWSAVYLSKRASEPDQSSIEATSQPLPQ